MTGRGAPAPPRTAAFFAVALAIALTAGAGLGSLLLAARHLPWPALSGPAFEAARSTHAHAQVFGFTALFVMGVAYHALPRLGGGGLERAAWARATLWLQIAGVVAHVLAGLAATPQRTILAASGSMFFLAGAGAFTGVVERALRHLPQDAPGTPWLRAGAWWLPLAAALDVAASAGVVAPRVVWDAALYGFVASWIFGMSLQFVPVLYGRPLAPFRARIVTAYQAAVAAMLLATLGPTTGGAARVADAALVAASLAIVARLPVFRPATAAGDRDAERFLTTAYAWFLVALACGPGWRVGAGLAGGTSPLLAEDFARHALTLGFLTQMIVGVTNRLVPTFSGRPLWSAGAGTATYWLLNLGIASRGLEVVIACNGPWRLWPWVALSGPLASLALVFFTAAVVRTARAPRAA